MTLAEIFGETSTGDDAVARATSSARVFVRSHMQLALDSETATGRRLSALEALEAFGLPILERVVAEGGAGLITDAREPARTLSERRKTLRLTKRELAQAAGVGVDEVTASETPGELLPIRSLEKLAQALALDERAIGLAGRPHGDREFGTRLRELRQADERDESFVLALADAAWVIARQSELSRKLKADRGLAAKFKTKSGDYSGQIWLRGYELAEQTRDRLGLDAEAPIQSMYSVAQDLLGIPVVDTELANEVAGATVLNGDARGIVLNKIGANRNIFTRRMTLAHELGHLLWDPDNRLEHVRVDESSDLRRRDNRDMVEARANAFAIAFLAPRAAVRRLYEEHTKDAQTTIANMVGEFGISALASAHHLANVCKLGANDVNKQRTVSASVAQRWTDNERQDNLVTGHVRPSRGNRFAQLTVQAARKHLITIDTASSWLRLDKRFLKDLF